jgi:hypothetical protein
MLTDAHVSFLKGIGHVRIRVQRYFIIANYEGKMWASPLGVLHLRGVGHLWKGSRMARQGWSHCGAQPLVWLCGLKAGDWRQPDPKGAAQNLYFFIARLYAVW